MYATDLRQTPRDAQASESTFDRWRAAWFYALAEEAQHLPLTALVTGLAGPLLCRNPDPAGQLLAWAVGRLVHLRIMQAYRAEYRGNRVSSDGRVFFPTGASERLSTLAARTPRSVYGALNWCLAGQRSDIVDLDRHEMWEIKPAGLASRALLQVFGYLDNYEAARVAEHYISAAPPPLAPGSPAALQSRVLTPFEIDINEDVSLYIAPYVTPKLPGLILYTPRVKLRRQPADQALARQAMALTSADVEQAITVARRDVQQLIEVRDAETRRLLVYAGIFVICVGVAVIAAPIVAAAAAGAGTSTAAVGTAAAIEGVADTTLVAGEVISLSAVPATTTATQTVAAVAPRIAASLTVYFAGREFLLPPETSGLCIEGGCELGSAVRPPVR